MVKDKIYPAYLFNGKVVYLKQILFNGQPIFVEVATPVSSTSTPFTPSSAIMSTRNIVILHQKK